MQQRGLRDSLRRLIRLVYFVAGQLKPEHDGHVNNQALLAQKHKYLFSLELLFTSYSIISAMEQDTTFNDFCRVLTQKLNKASPLPLMGSFLHMGRLLHTNHCDETTFDVALMSSMNAYEHHHPPVQQQPAPQVVYITDDLSAKQFSYFKAAAVFVIIAFLIKRSSLSKVRRSSHKQIKNMVDTLLNYGFLLVLNSENLTFSKRLGAYTALVYLPDWYNKKLKLLFNDEPDTDQQFKKLDRYLDLGLFFAIWLDVRRDRTNHFAKLMLYMTLRYGLDTLSEITMPNRKPQVVEETLPNTTT